MPVKPPKKVWDDEEEAEYREWLKNQKGNEERAEFSEYKKEFEYRERLREDTKRRGSDSHHKVDWDNKEELQLQEKYRRDDKERFRIFRKGKRHSCHPAIDWDDTGETAAREKAKEKAKDRKKGPVVWDVDKFGFHI